MLSPIAIRGGAFRPFLYVKFERIRANDADAKEMPVCGNLSELTVY